MEQRINVALGTQSALLTLTTADGAEVRLSSAGDSNGRKGSLRFNGAARVVGGTGRFSSAIGAIRTEGGAPNGGERGGNGVLRIDGWITYPGGEPSGAAEGGER